MGARIMGGAWGTAAGYPSQRRDRSLDVAIGFHPEASRDDDILFGAWAMEVWQGWNQWVGAPSCMFSGDAVIDPQPYFVGTVWASDVRWSGSHQSPYTIRGQCLDANGNPVPGATVELWLSAAPVGFTGGGSQAQGGPGNLSPEVFIASLVADANGLYAFWVPDNTTKYFVIAFLSDKAGISARNLVGS